MLQRILTWKKDLNDNPFNLLIILTTSMKHLYVNYPSLYVVDIDKEQDKDWSLGNIAACNWKPGRFWSSYKDSLFSTGQLVFNPSLYERTNPPVDSLTNTKIQTIIITNIYLNIQNSKQWLDLSLRN